MTISEFSREPLTTPEDQIRQAAFLLDVFEHCEACRRST